MPDVVLAAGRDRSVRRRHPWLLSGAVASVTGAPGPGDEVRVLSAEGEVVGHGHYAPRSPLRVRLFEFGKESPVDGWLAERIARAVRRRALDPGLAETDAVRLVNAEGDDLPGLLADRFGDVVVVRLGAAGMAERRDEIAAALRAATGAAAGFERADTAALRREGVPARQGPLWGEPPSAPIAIHERGRDYLVDVVEGQKTGFYLDQRDARDRVQALAAGRRVLDLFAYTGGFAVAAARGGASALTLVESSVSALELARENVARAGAARAELVQGDAFAFLRGGEREPFDLIVVDPPPLARRRGDAPRAARAYKDLLLHALRAAAPDALVLAFRCSHAVSAELFRQIAFGAALDAARPAQVLSVLGPPSDHPVSLQHPEGDYLSGLLLRA